MKQINDCYTLSNGMKIPCVGYGTYKAVEGKGAAVIKDAIRAGYRYFDTASLYETERELGEAMKDSGLPREDFFIVSKAWWDELGYQEVQDALERSLGRLQTEYLDIYLIHWPKQSEDAANWKELLTETWKGMEDLYDAGKIKAIGLSNFLPHHLDHILSIARVKPVVDQLEIHPGYSQERAVAYCKEKGVRPQAWSPLGRSAMIENPIMKTFAEKYGKSVAQICLRFLVQKEIIPLVKTANYDRMKENMDIFDFELTQEDLHILECMPQDTWLGEHPDFAIPKKRSNFDQ